MCHRACKCLLVWWGAGALPGVYLPCGGTQDCDVGKLPDGVSAPIPYDGNRTFGAGGEIQVGLRQSAQGKRIPSLGRVEF